MRLDQLLPGVSLPADLAAAEGSAITHDSREARPGTVFFALRGGHAFVDSALEKAAALVVVSEGTDEAVRLRGNPRVVAVPDSARALGTAASAFFGNPTHSLKLVGVTGTNGKTTSTYLLEAIFSEAGLPAGVIGTIETRFGGTVETATHTTPDALALQARLADFARRGARAAAIEVSSHALEQHRAWGCRFAAALFTNLTQDHLDYHGDMESYFQSKTRLFTEYDVGIRVVHVEDPYGRRLADLLDKLRLPVLTFGGAGADLDYSGLASTASGISGTLRARRDGIRTDVRIQSPLLGAFNAQNIAGCAAVALGLRIPPETIASAVAEVSNIPGRLERVRNSRGLHVVVDYAHTPDALRKALETLRPLCAGKLICVFGCGGDRDEGKRPRMGAVAEELADAVILTSDNPRTEDPDAILAEVVAGLKDPGRTQVIPDRARAITAAISALGPDDFLLIAGKGHEDYQIVGTKKLPFDDRKVAAEYLEKGRRC